MKSSIVICYNINKCTYLLTNQGREHEQSTENLLSKQLQNEMTMLAVGSWVH